MRGFLQGAVSVRQLAASAAIAFVAAILVAGLFGSLQPANAQQGFGNYFGYQTNKPAKRRVRRTRTSKPVEQTAEKNDAKKDEGPSGPVYVVISIGDQRISVYDRTGRIARSSVSTGMRGHATPTGVFSVIGKSRWHRSNIYAGAPMPWMQRITWSGIAMHAGVVPGYPASHGCIRLPYSFAPQLYKMTKMGARVVVVRNDTIPSEISHSFLPLPTMRPAPGGAQQASHAAEPHIELASMETPARVDVATSSLSDDPSSATLQPALLNPIAYASALKERAKADKQSAEEAEKLALAAAQTAGEEARQAVEDVSKSKAEAEAAEAHLAVLEGAPSVPQGKDPADDSSTEASREAMETARTAARSELIRARAALDAASRREAERTPAAFRAVEVWKAAVAATETAANTLKEASRRADPVSVFISKKEGRIFVRQDWKEVYEAPVTIRDPEHPLGTHVYVAVGAEPDGSAMHWSAISVPPQEDRSGDRRKKKGAAKDVPELPLAKTAIDSTGPATAAGVLDRIEMPEEARRRISELLWTGASLIVSDHGRSHEMGEYTDFIVTTR